MKSHVWPCHPRPLQDELLSSWLTRAAMANDQKISAIIQIAAGKRTKVAQKYIDGSLPISFLKGFSNCLAVPESSLMNMTLDSYAGIIYERSTLRSKRRGGILNAGETRRHLFFQQYCPACLREGTPYYRKIWRLSCMTVCPIHKCKLFDRCSGCGHPVLVMANDAKSNYLPYSGNFTDCSFCGSDLKAAVPEVADSSIVAETAWYLLILNSGFVRLHHDGRWTYSFVFFALLRLMMMLVVVKSLKTGNVESYYTDPDSYEVSSRYAALKVLCGAFYQWPHRFLSLCEHWGVRYYQIETIQKVLNYVPFILESDVKSQLYRPNIGPTAESVLAAIDVMEKRGLIINITTLNQFMGFSDSSLIKEIFKKERFK
tara:strand:+ start:63845 stop:64960 length:1116 start_codon:yes stop_codon:yes gene_type:complete